MVTSARPSSLTGSQIYDIRQLMAASLRGDVDPVEKARQDFRFYLENVVKDENPGVSTEYLTLAPFHEEIANAIADPKITFLLVECFRGAGKSTLASVAYPAWAAGKEPNLRIALVSKTDDQAVTQLTGVEAILRSPEHQRVFGDQIPRRDTYNYRVPWTANEKVLIRPRFSRFPTFLAFGAESAAPVGKRFDILCCDPETMVLTMGGWRLFKDLVQDDNVATLTPDGFIEFQRPSRIIAKNYSGKMHYGSSPHFSFGVTEGHDLWVSHRKSTSIKGKFVDQGWMPFSKVPVEVVAKHPKQYKFQRDAKWRGVGISEVVIPELSITWKCGPGFSVERCKFFPKKHIPIGPFLALLGFWLAEGTIGSRNGFPTTVRIFQNLGQTLTKFLEVIEDCGFSFKTRKHSNSSKMVDVAIHSAQLARFLATECGHGSHNKRIPSWVKELTPSLLQILFQWYMLGDGNKRLAGWMATTASRQLADDFQEVGLKLGYGVSESQIPPKLLKGYLCSQAYGTYFSEGKKHPRFWYGSTWETFDYDGPVYCVTVPNGIILTKHRGKVVWLGNCVDDIIDLQSAFSETVRDRINSWFFRVLLPTRDPRWSKTIVIGTPWVKGDIYNVIKEEMSKRSHFKYIRQPAIIVTPEGKETSAWPEVFPIERLRQLRDESLFSFLNQYQLERYDITSARLKAEWLKYIPQDQIDYSSLAYYMGIDPNAGRKTGKAGDYMAVGVVGVDPAGQGYLVDLCYIKGDIKVTMDELMAAIYRWNPRVISTEIDAAQAHFKNYLESKLERSISGVSSKSVPKFIRINHMADQFSAGRILVAAAQDWETGSLEALPSLKPFVDEWKAYIPESGHDDALDSVTLALDPIMGYGGPLASLTVSPNKIRVDGSARKADDDLDRLVEQYRRSLDGRNQRGSLQRTISAFPRLPNLSRRIGRI